MPAPVRITLKGTGLSISAFLIADIMPAGSQVTCKICSPYKTKMRILAEVAIYEPDRDRRYVIWECLHCRRQWAQMVEIDIQEVATVS
jgi:hypothetical protein